MRALFVIACLSVASGEAMATGPQQADAVAVTIYATVLDRGGRPVTGLAAPDFSVELDGRVQRIISVTYLPAGPPMAGAVGPVFDAVSPITAPVYRVVIEPPDGTRAGTEFAVAIVVKRPDSKIVADPRAIAAPAAGRAARPAASPSAGASTEDRLRTAIATGRPQRGLPISIGTTLRRASDPAQISLDVQIEIAASAKAPLTTLLGVVDARGAIRSASKTLDAAGAADYRVDFSLPIAAGAYKVRFAAADASGAMGAVESIVRAELSTMGPLLASELVRWTASSGGQPQPLSLAQIPAGATTLGATLELYVGDAGPPPDLLVKVALAPGAGEQPALIERIVTPEARDGRLVAEAEFPLERVNSGTYLLRAVVLSGTTTLGTTSATVIRR